MGESMSNLDYAPFVKLWEDQELQEKYLIVQLQILEIWKFWQRYANEEQQERWLKAFA